MAVTVVSGVPGVGKTAALGLLRTQQPIVNFGTLMLSVARQRFPSLGRDALRAIPSTDRDLLRREAVHQLPDPCILDMHLSIRTAEGFEPSVPDALRSRRLDVIIILEAPAEEVLARRAGRQGRVEQIDTIEDVRSHQEVNRAAGEELARYTGAQLEVLMTSPTPEQTGRAIGEILNRRMAR